MQKAKYKIYDQSSISTDKKVCIKEEDYQILFWKFWKSLKVLKKRRRKMKIESFDNDLKDGEEDEED
jgi:hypothetical protein